LREQSHVAIIGAGPYGLSIAAHLRAAGTPFRIFGRPLQYWCEQMPNGMLLKSDGFASNLSDPAAAFTLQRFCAMSGIPYDHTRLPVSLETFRAYGLAFQKRMVPELEEQDVARVEVEPDGYRLYLSDGTTALAPTVVVAAGIGRYAHVPESLLRLPGERVSHSSHVSEPERWRGRVVTVVGAGASAIDTAVLLQEAGADVTLVARATSLKFAGPPPPNGRTWWDGVRSPSSPIGPGWRSRLFCDFPWLFHRLPATLRVKLVAQHIAPAAGYPMKDRFTGKVPALLGYEIDRAAIDRGRVRLVLRGNGTTREHTTDHVVAATGYRVDVQRLTFLSADIRARLRLVNRAPALSADFESSVPDLFFVGPASANSFGPIMRFACGADWTARRITMRLARHAREKAALPFLQAARGGASTGP
jgi:cation diffusion facilitator CzcD-associated flavoprotein CzcO